jgi:hypothetical protein
MDFREHHVDIVLFGQAHDLVKRPPAVVLALRIGLVVSNMAVCGDEDPDRVDTYILLALRPVIRE